MPLRPRPPPEPPPVIHTDTHYAAIWSDVHVHIFSLFTCNDNLWVCAPAHTALGDMQQFRKVCAIERHVLRATPAALRNTETTQTQRLICFSRSTEQVTLHTHTLAKGKQSWLRFSTRCTGLWVTQTWADGQNSCRLASPSGRTPPSPPFVPSAARRTQTHGLFMFHPHTSSYMYV